MALCDGFALLEVLIALLLLAFGTLASAAGMTLALRAAHAARAQHHAVALLADFGELLRASDPSDRPSLARAWQVTATDRVSPASPANFAAVAQRLSSPAQGVDAWRLDLEWRDRLGVASLHIAERLDLLR